MEEIKARRSDRISLELPITVAGTDALGSVFVMEGKTILVSRQGAKILLARKLAPHQEISIRCILTRREADARVVGQIGKNEESYYYGVAFLNPEVNIWKIEFPPLGEGDDAVGRVVLECGGCHIRELTYLDESELEVLEENQSLARHCKRCTDYTVWKKSSVEGGVVEAPTHPLPVPAPARTADLRRERRRDVRVPVCVRREGADEEIVRSRNASRGGLCFESTRQYSKGARIEVAIPYTPGGGNIFLAGNVVRVQNDPGSGLTLYGVSYIRRPS